jgi:hypothetical protein
VHRVIAYASLPSHENERGHSHSVAGPILGRAAIAQSTDDKTKPDNTAVNKQDREATADQQKMNAADCDTSAKIRRTVITLEGWVRSDDEVASIVSKTTDVTGSADKVINQMSVKPTSKPRTG